MSNTDFFPERPKLTPTIYAYSDSNPIYEGMLKVGYTTLTAQERVAQQYPINLPRKPYTIVVDEPAIQSNGSTFMDHEVHKYLERKGFRRLLDEKGQKTEWFKCSKEDVLNAIQSIRNGTEFEISRTENFSMRPEQEKAVNKTIAYFSAYHQENSDKIPHFLWNAKMRFGKTFATYQLAKKMGWKRVLILTFKPAVQDAWESDLKTHIDFEGWQFICNRKKSKEECILDVEHLDMARPIVCFGSFQDFLGKNKDGGIKAKNEWVHTTNWDCIVLDEYHFGSWRESAKELFEAEDKKEQDFGKGVGIEDFDEDIMPITTNHYLYLSGTPFRAINSGEFIEEQIFNWTYTDEQKAKENWKGDKNPYASLPRMVMMTYQMPDDIRDVALKGEFDEFDLNTFFYAEGEKEQAKFKFENEVQKWLELIRGSLRETTIDNLKMGAKKPPMPFGDARLKDILIHTFWFLPTVSSCYAMKNLLERRQNKTFFGDYNIIVAAGTSAGIGVEALGPVYDKMENPLKTKTITLSCGKLTTGVSVKPWSGIFMLRNSSSPETYFQAAFRVQTPWTIDNPTGENPNEKAIMKNECYVFDFAPDRALHQIADYSCRLKVDETASPEQKVAEFIQFLPVLAYDGSSMRQIDAEGILDLTTSGTTATLLARRWESALLVNVDDVTLKRLMNNEEALNALQKVEGFRSLNKDIETIINRSNAVKNAKKKSGNGDDLTPGEKRQLTEDEKKMKSLRKQVQEKLIKFATRVPIFMYLTDYREKTLRDVITQLEPGLFKKVTGLDVKDFELLVSLNVFNGALMNDAVYKFKRYEDASLEYAGINKHEGEKIGLYDTTISREDADILGI